MTEEQAMRRALELAWNGWGQVAPNPLVGAVLMREGKVVGEGWHRRFGGPHAEVEALGGCADPTGTTCVVTLEPCNHHGKTPPCVDALIEARVARVVAAVRDPHVQAGGGLQRLRSAGVHVDVGMLRADAAVQNAAFLWGAARPNRPFVALKVATSIDGFIADVDGRSRWISGEAARAWVQWLRAGYDAIGVGRRTAVLDDPVLTVRGSVVPRIAPKRVIFSRTGDIPADLSMVRSASEVETVLITAPNGRTKAREELAQHAGLTVVAAAALDDALVALRAAGVRAILIEGGGELAGNLLEQGLIDRLYWVQSPTWLGRGTPAFGERHAIRLEDAKRWVVAGRKALGEDSLVVLDRELCLQGS